MTFPPNREQRIRIHHMSKFQFLLELRLRTKNTSWIHKFGTSTCPETNSYRIPWSAFAKRSLPKLSQRKITWASHKDAQWTRAYHGTHIEALFSIIHQGHLRKGPRAKNWQIWRVLLQRRNQMEGQGLCHLGPSL